MALRILIINENEGFCAVMSGMLTADGHAASCVTGIREALKAVNAEKPGLVILEVAAGKVGALETMSRLQRNEETRQIPLIVISEYPELEYELLKVFDFIPKPVNLERLREDIAALDNGGKRPALPLRIEPLSDSNYQLIHDYLVAFSGLHFDRRNIRLLDRGLVNRMTALKINSYLEYFDYLIMHRDSRQELQKLLQFLTIGETYFFRYRAHFSALNRIVAAEFALKKEKKLRLWSAGCSTGEEPYSMAITIMEALPDWREWDIKILATDINNQSLQRAREGVYRAWAMRVTDEGRLGRYFTKNRDKYLLKQEVKDLVEFSHLNLQTGEFPTPKGEFRAMDAVFCRNVMIYFTFESMKLIVEKLTDCLNPGGYLFLGHSETLTHISSRFDRLSQEGGFYYRKREGQSGPQHPKAKPAPPAKTAQEKREISPAKPVVVQAALHPVKLPSEPKPVCDVEAIYRQAKLQFDAENFTEASRLLSEVTRVEPGHIGAFILQGFIAANRGEYENVLIVCDAVLALNDLQPEVYFLKGLVLEMMDKPHDAAEEYRKAILLDMDAVMPHYNLGRLYVRLGREKDGLRELKNCLKILEKSHEESVVPYSGGLTREVFLEHLRNELFHVA